MSNELKTKQKNRFMLLHKLYDVTGGVAERKIIDIAALGVELGMSKDLAFDTFEYLKGEGLVKWMTLGGGGAITHWGLKEVEDALDEKPTAHFPANIVVLTNSPNSSIVTGNVTTNFDQRGQTVSYQYNAAGNINVNGVQDVADLIEQLGLLKVELQRAHNAELVDDLTESRIKNLILEALEESKKPHPEKVAVIGYLKRGAELLSAISATSELATAFTGLCERVNLHL